MEHRFWGNKTFWISMLMKRTQSESWAVALRSNKVSRLGSQDDPQHSQDKKAAHSGKKLVIMHFIDANILTSFSSWKQAENQT